MVEAVTGLRQKQLSSTHVSGINAVHAAKGIGVPCLDFMPQREVALSGVRAASVSVGIASEAIGRGVREEDADGHEVCGSEHIAQLQQSKGSLLRVEEKVSEAARAVELVEAEKHRSRRAIAFYRYKYKRDLYR